MPDIWPFAAWCYRRNTLDSTRLLSLCILSLAFTCCSHQVGEQWSSGHQNVLGSVSKICIIHLPIILFTFICGRGNSFVPALNSCDLVLLWQKDSSLVSDCSFKEGSLKMSEAKVEPQEGSKAWGKDGARGSQGEGSLKTRLKWGKLIPAKSSGQFPYCCCFLHTCNRLPKQDKEQ